MGIETSIFGKTKDGETVSLYKMYNDYMEIVVTDYGACLVNVWFRDRRGRFQDLVWGYDTLEQYEVNSPKFGATIGRNANRIGGAKIEIGGAEYVLDKNNGENNLHSGFKGYQHRVWEAWTDMEGSEPSVTFLLNSPHMDQGYPGAAKISVKYTLTEDNTIRIDYKGKADADTVFNMTNHSYFNLEGQTSDSILDHVVEIYADAFTPTDASLIPTGEIRSVEDTPMDFREERRIGDFIGADYEPLTIAGGYDHNWVLNDPGHLHPVAYVYSPNSGIEMEVDTDLPGIQMYTGNFLNDESGKDGKLYGNHSAVCFETQFFPDACHHPEFPDTIVKAGEMYRTTTIYKFGRKG